MIRRLGSYMTWSRVLVAAALLAVLAGLVVLGQAMQATINAAAIRGWLAELGVWGPVALIAGLAAVLVVPAIPASVFQIGAGLAFGPMLGLLCVTAADVLGSSAGFVLARYWGRSLLRQHLAQETQLKIERLAQRLNWRGVFLLRLLPGPVYPLVSMAAGYSPLGYLRFLSASLLGVFPGLALLVFAGDMASSTPLLGIALVLLVFAGLALAGHFFRFGKE